MKEIFEPMIEDIAKNAAEANAAQQGDYIGADGLLFCGKCHTPKEHIIDFPSTQKVGCMCRCVAEAYNRRREEDELRSRADKVLANAFDEPELKQWTFANDNGLTPQYTGAAWKYCEHFEELREQGRGLLLWHTTPGSGKSWLAAAIVNELCSRGISCRFTTFGRILSDIQSTFNERDYIDHLLSHSLLVFDDFGMERNTPYATEKVFGILNARLNSRKPMLFTTNLSIEEIKNPPTTDAARLYSRVLDVSHPIHVDFYDRRKMNAAKNYQPMKELLGI